jgi:transcription initiation factor TFIIIB Brf1 subunit/transcription initiation factor TFIIB
MSKISKQDTISEYSSIVCPNCNANFGSSNKNGNKINMITDPESGEHICGNCGLVLSIEKVEETRPEWRNFDSEQKTTIE